MRQFFSALILIPLAVVLVVFAVANRHFVTLSFDPFNSVDPAVAVSLPLFVVIVAVAILGVVAGGLATWFRQGHWRRAARRNEAEAHHARVELADLRIHAANLARSAPQRPMAPVPARLGHDASERDKTIATL